MAINFTVSYTFAPGTTISSSQVNTNFSDNANVWTGLEALTKSFSALRVDATPTTSTDVAIKSYVDKLNAYRRPILQYSSGSQVNMETGIDGTSGEAMILFSDGTRRTDSTSGRINCTMSQTAAFSGSAQSGIDTGSVSNTTWYSFYAVKVTDSSTNFVMAASALVPTQANFSTLNSRLGTNGWVYLGVLPYGDGSAVTNAICKFGMAGNTIKLINIPSVSAANVVLGVRVANSASTNALAYTYAAGTTVGTQIPAQLRLGYWMADVSNGVLITGSSDAALEHFINNVVGALIIENGPLEITQGFRNFSSSATATSLTLSGYVDGALGVGANPLL